MILLHREIQLYSQSFQMLVVGEHLWMNAFQGVIGEDAGTSKARNYN
jgi:hypothetical protein